MAFTYSDGMKKIPLSLALSQWQMMMNDTPPSTYAYTRRTKEGGVSV